MKKIVTQLLIFTLGTLSLIFSQEDGVFLTIDNVNEDNKIFDILYSSPVGIEGFQFDIVYTSVLKRACRTMEICLHEMKLNDIKIEYDWRLNERHYGALQ